MTGKELVKAFRAIAKALEAMPSVDGMTFELGEAAVLTVRSKAAVRAHRHRRKRDLDVTQDVTKSVTRVTQTVTQTAPGQAGGASSAARTSSLRSKEIQVVEDTDRSSHVRASWPETTTSTTPENRDRKHGVAPLPRKDLLPTPLHPHEWKPMDDHREYASELGLTEPQFDQLLIELRDKHGLRPHTRDWWDDRCNRFIEARSKGPRKTEALDEQDRLLAGQALRLAEIKQDLA